MRAAPAKLAALEARVAVLEKALAEKPLDGPRCQFCAAEAKLVDERPDVVLGKAGVLRQKWDCASCGKTQDRMRKMI